MTNWKEKLHYKAHLCLLLADHDEKAASTLMDLTDAQIVRRAKKAGKFVPFCEGEFDAGMGLGVSSMSDANQVARWLQRGIHD